MKLKPKDKTYYAWQYTGDVTDMPKWMIHFSFYFGRGYKITVEGNEVAVGDWILYHEKTHSLTVLGARTVQKFFEEVYEDTNVA